MLYIHCMFHSVLLQQWVLSQGWSNWTVLCWLGLQMRDIHTQKGNEIGIPREDFTLIWGYWRQPGSWGDHKRKIDRHNFFKKKYLEVLYTKKNLVILWTKKNLQHIRQIIIFISSYIKKYYKSFGNKCRHYSTSKEYHQWIKKTKIYVLIAFTV